jgi:hypothetical protein
LPLVARTFYFRQLGWRKKYLKYVKDGVRMENYGNRIKKLVELYCECTDIFIQKTIRQEVYSHLHFKKKWFDRLVEDYHRDKTFNFKGPA